MKDKYDLADGPRSLEIYRVEGDNHNAGMMMVYLPKEKILVEADDFTPAAPNSPAAGGRERIAGFKKASAEVASREVHSAAGHAASPPFPASDPVAFEI